MSPPRIAGGPREPDQLLEQLYLSLVLRVEVELVGTGGQLCHLIVVHRRELAQTLERRRAAGGGREGLHVAGARPLDVGSSAEAQLGELAAGARPVVAILRAFNGLLEQQLELVVALCLAQESLELLLRRAVLEALQCGAVVTLGGVGIGEVISEQISKRRAEIREGLVAVRLRDALLEDRHTLAVAPQPRQAAVHDSEGLVVVGVALEQRLQGLDRALRSPLALVEHGDLELAHVGWPVDVLECLEGADQALGLAEAAVHAHAQTMHLRVLGRVGHHALEPGPGRFVVLRLLQLQPRSLERQLRSLLARLELLPEPALQKLDAVAVAGRALDLDQALADGALLGSSRDDGPERSAQARVAVGQEAGELQQRLDACVSLERLQAALEQIRHRLGLPRALEELGQPRERSIAGGVQLQRFEITALRLVVVGGLLPELAALRQRTCPLVGRALDALVDVGDLERRCEIAGVRVGTPQAREPLGVLGLEVQQILVALSSSGRRLETLLEQPGQPQQHVHPSRMALFGSGEPALVDPGELAPGPRDVQVLLQLRECSLV